MKKENNKILPEGYKGKYCETCMNKKAHGIKNILTGVCSVLGVVNKIFVAHINKQ